MEMMNKKEEEEEERKGREERGEVLRIPPSTREECVVKVEAMRGERGMVRSGGKGEIVPYNKVRMMRRGEGK